MSSTLTRVTKKNALENVVEFNSKKQATSASKMGAKVKTRTKDTENKIEDTLTEKDIFSNNSLAKLKDLSAENMSLKQAKFDVFKFGIKGFAKADQESAKIQMAIKLGAAPPKNKCINYKELVSKKNDEKLEREELIKENRLFEAKIAMSHKNFSIKKKNSRDKSNNRKSKISKGNVGLLKGHIGSFSNGVLKIKKNDIKKFSK